MEAAEVGFNFSKRFDGGTRKCSKRLAALTASSLRFAPGAMFHNSMSLGYVRKLRYWRRLFARRFDCGSHVLSALECTSDVVVVRAAVEGEQLQTMRTLHLKAITNPLDPLAKYHRAFRAFDFDLSFDHRRASGRPASYHAKRNCFDGAKRARFGVGAAAGVRWGWAICCGFGGALSLFDWTRSHVLLSPTSKPDLQTIS